MGATYFMKNFMYIYTTRFRMQEIFEAIGTLGLPSRICFCMEIFASYFIMIIIQPSLFYYENELETIFYTDESLIACL